MWSESHIKASITSSPHRLKLKELNFAGDIAWRCATSANHFWDSPDVSDISMAQTLPEFTDRYTDIAVKTTVAVCEKHVAPTTRLYTPQHYVMNTHRATLSFPTFLGLNNWCCAKRTIKSAVVNDRKWQALPPPDATSNANCGWHRALWHNWTGSGWFYHPDPMFLSFPTCVGPQPLIQCGNDE